MSKNITLTTRNRKKKKEVIGKPRILVSVSGGETSAMMAYIINKKYPASEYDVIYVFANTSREKEKTLVFLQNIEKHWGINVVWVEAVVHHGKKIGSTHKVVSFETAKRKGEVFTEVIKKYGIPNRAFPHCTRELKTNPIRSYCRSIGWKNKTYKIAIGYRADEMHRVKWAKEKTQNHWYLLPRLGINKDQVKNFFLEEMFELGLKEHEGNCKVCFKKSKRKLLTQIVEDGPDVVDWINEMEIAYGLTPTDRAANASDEEKPFKFFKDNESIWDLVEQSKLPFEKFEERKYDYSVTFDVEMDYEDECSKNCEPFK